MQPIEATKIPMGPAQAGPWRDKLTLLLESTGDGIFGIDLDGRCIFINRAGAALLGMRVDQTLGHNMHDLIHHTHEDGRHYPETACPIFRAFRQGQPCRVDNEVFWRAGGTSFPTEYASYPIVENRQVLGAVVTFNDITERRRAEHMLRQAKEDLEARVADRTRELSDAVVQLRELSSHLNSVREEERMRIAREIHDELGSLLVALRLDTTWLERRLEGRDELTGKCRSMARAIEGAVENVGRIITDLRPSILDHQGLMAALEWHLQEFRDATELDCRSHIHQAADAAPPEGQMATAVFRIFQEMLSNVARHARAKAVEIMIVLEPSMLLITVRDDGAGAAVTDFENSRSYGVMGMRERAGYFGGDLAITSTPGLGTRVQLSIPLVPPAAAAPP